MHLFLFCGSQGRREKSFHFSFFFFPVSLFFFILSSFFSVDPIDILISPAKNYQTQVWTWQTKFFFFFFFSMNTRIQRFSAEQSKKPLNRAKWFGLCRETRHVFNSDRRVFTRWQGVVWQPVTFSVVVNIALNSKTELELKWSDDTRFIIYKNAMFFKWYGDCLGSKIGWVRVSVFGKLPSSQAFPL